MGERRQRKWVFVMDPPSAIDRKAKAFITWETAGDTKMLLYRMLDVLDADEVRFRDKCFARPGFTLFKFTAYSKGKCINDKVKEYMGTLSQFNETRG